MRKQSSKSKYNLDLRPFDTKINRGPPQHTCEVSSLRVKRKRSYRAETTFPQMDSHGETSITPPQTTSFAGGITRSSHDMTPRPRHILNHRL